MLPYKRLGFFDSPFAFLDSFPGFPSVNKGRSNIRENDKSYFIDIVMPGFDKSEIGISFENDCLKVSAEKKSEKNQKDEYLVHEFTVDSITRYFDLSNVDKEKINAVYENGILKIKAEKLDKSAYSKKIEIN